MVIAPRLPYQTSGSVMSYRPCVSYATAGARPNAFAYGLFTLFFAREVFSNFERVSRSSHSAHSQVCINRQSLASPENTRTARRALSMNARLLIFQDSFDASLRLAFLYVLTFVCLFLTAGNCDLELDISAIIMPF